MELLEKCAASPSTYSLIVVCGNFKLCSFAYFSAPTNALPLTILSLLPLISILASIKIIMSGFLWATEGYGKLNTRPASIVIILSSLPSPVFGEFCVVSRPCTGFKNSFLKGRQSFNNGAQLAICLIWPVNAEPHTASSVVSGCSGAWFWECPYMNFLPKDHVGRWRL